MEQEKNSFLYKLPPDLTNILTNGLNKCYVLIVQEYNFYPQRMPNGGVHGIFLNFTEAIFYLLRLTGLTSYDNGIYPSIYDEGNDTWEIPEDTANNTKYEIFIFESEYNRPSFKECETRYLIGWNEEAYRLVKTVNKRYVTVNLDFKPLISFIETLKKIHKPTIIHKGKRHLTDPTP